MDIICKPYHMAKDSYISSITEEIDKYLLDEWKNTTFKTYILRYDKGIAIRFPGATRGHIEIDNNSIIQKIVLYEDTCFRLLKCYKLVVKEIITKYIGSKLIFE